MIDHECYECGAKLAMRAHKEIVRVGRYKVEDSSTMVPVCAKGHTEISVEMMAEYERRAAIVVLSEAAEISGQEIRFARKSVGLTQVELAQLLEVASETISRWENDRETMSRVSRLALLAVVRELESLRATPVSASKTLKIHAA